MNKYLPKNILIVDNDPQFLHVLEAFLVNEGFSVFRAASSKEAFDVMCCQRINMAIVDECLERDGSHDDMSGTTLMRALPPHIVPLPMTEGGPPRQWSTKIIKGMNNANVPKNYFISKREMQTWLDVIWKQFRTRLNLDLEIELEAGLSKDGLVSTLSGDFTQDEFDELLCMLFRSESSVRIEYLTPGMSQTGIAIAIPEYPGGMQGLPVVVKYGAREKILHEIDMYRTYVETFIVHHSTLLIGQAAQTNQMAGCKFLFLGAAGDELSEALEDRPVSFAEVYRNRPVDHHDPTGVSNEALAEIIRNIFKKGSRAWYAGKRRRREDEELATLMPTMFTIGHWQNNRDLEHVLNLLLEDEPLGMIHFKRVDKYTIRIEMGGQIEDYPDPVASFERMGAVIPEPTIFAITHGDLHPGNLFVDPRTRKTWLIDFYKTGWGPALRDAAEMETAIKFDLLTADQLKVLMDFEKRILQPNRFDDQIEESKSAITLSPALQRAEVAVKAVREAAYWIHEVEDMRDYYAMLLYNALKVLSLKRSSAMGVKRLKDKIHLYHALYSALLLAKKFVPNYARVSGTGSGQYPV